MKAATTRSGRSAKVIAASVVAGLIGSGALVWQASSAAFTATTFNDGNSWASGKVVLSDNDSGIALFTETDLVPGSTDTQCIEVTYDGTVESTVTLYSNTPTGALGEFLDIDVSYGAGTDCTTPGVLTQIFGDVDVTPDDTADTLDNLAALHTDFASGAGAWEPDSPGTVKPYVFTYTLGDDDDAQDLSATNVRFTWEAQNNS